MGRLTRADWAIRAVSIPPILGVIGWLGVLAVSAITGRHPILDTRARNVAEAAAFRDGGEVVRRAGRGEDLNRAAEVRGGFVGPQAATMVPIEAAAAARDREIVQLLFDLGAAPDAVTWQRAWCASDEPEVRMLLDAHRPAGARDECGDRP